VREGLGFWESGLGGSLSGSESLAHRLGVWLTDDWDLVWKWMGGFVWVGRLLGVWESGNLEWRGWKPDWNRPANLRT
jgi:hypothetical protein